MTAVVERQKIQIGGGYTAVDNGDDTYDILNVPIFAQIPAGVKRNAKPIERQWQDKALLRNRQREQEGYLPPVHIYHSDEMAVKPTYAGKMRLRAVQLASYQGQMLWTTFTDIIGMPAAVFLDKVKPGFLPYRSVEILNWDKEEIDSLALMDTDVPFFRMPMTTIGRVVKRGEAEMFTSRGPAVWCRSAERSIAVLFRFGDAKMADKKNKQDEDETGTTKTDGSEAGGPGSEPDASSRIEPVEPEVMEDEVAAPAAPAAAPASGELGTIMGMLQMILARLAPQPTPEEPVAPHAGFKVNKEKTPMTTPKTPPAAGDMFKEGGMTPETFRAFLSETVAQAVAPVTAELETFKAKWAERERADGNTARFNDAMKKLEGRHLTDGAIKLLKEVSGNETLLNQTVETFKANLPAEPASSGSDMEASLASAMTETSSAAGSDGALASFSAKHQGPQAMGWAKGQIAAFAAYKKAMPSVDMTIEEWLEHNWRAETMHVSNKV